MCKLIDLLLHSAPDFGSIAAACLKNDSWTVCAARAIQEHLATAHFNKMRILLAWTRQNWRPNEVRTFACGAALLIGATSYGQDPEKAADATVSATIKAANATADGTEKAVKTAGDAVEKAKDVVEH